MTQSFFASIEGLVEKVRNANSHSDAAVATFIELANALNSAPANDEIAYAQRIARQILESGQEPTRTEMDRLIDAIALIYPRPQQAVTRFRSSANAAIDLISLNAAPRPRAVMSPVRAASVPLSAFASGPITSPIDSVEALGAMVKERRRGMKLNQQQFADLAGVGRRFVSELEAGKPSLEIGKVLLVSRAAGIDLLAVSR